MDNPGSYALAALGITAALSAEAQTAIANLEGMDAVSIEAEFLYGSGGTSCSATVQTRRTGGNWRDIARFDFTTASGTKHATIARGAAGVSSYPGLGAEGVYQGFLGTELRAIVTSVGVYADSTTLNVYAVVSGS